MPVCRTLVTLYMFVNHVVVSPCTLLYRRPSTLLFDIGIHCQKRRRLLLNLVAIVTRQDFVRMLLSGKNLSHSLLVIHILYCCHTFPTPALQLAVPFLQYTVYVAIVVCCLCCSNHCCDAVVLVAHCLSRNSHGLASSRTSAGVLSKRNRFHVLVNRSVIQGPLGLYQYSSVPLPSFPSRFTPPPPACNNDLHFAYPVFLAQHPVSCPILNAFSFIYIVLLHY